MKRSISWILVIVLALAAVAMGVLWQRALRDDSDMAALAQAAAGEAYTRFSDYQERGDDGDYWGGVAAFHTFQEAYACMEAGPSQAANRTFCSEVYGALLLSPEQGKAHMAEMLDAVALLAADVRDENGYLRLADLRNTLRE